ncbi:MAG TPA: DUF4350 domain-containing protein [Vicinamibacteria bacterium]|nr:DUF4350 domain-containing protein [Vicinamibacteria bacterium]
MKRGEWLFPALFLGLLFVGYGLVPIPQSREKTDSFGSERSGKKVFFDLASRLLPDVKRSAGSLVPEDPDADVLVLLGPARYPDRAQWQTLHDWVSEGRALVFAAKWQDPAVELEPFGIEIVPAVAEGSEDVDESASEAPPAFESDLVEGPVQWRSEGQVRFTDPKGTIVVSTGGWPQVIWQPVGDGIIIVAASDFIFSNLSVIEPANAVLAFRILEQGTPGGTVYFDEGLNQAGAPRVVGVLLEGPLRLPTLQLLVVTLLFGWMVSRRFGPLVRKGRSERRSLVEHAEALGSLHYKVQTGASLLGSYLEYFGRELGLAVRTGPKGRVLEDVRGRGKDAKETISRAIRAAKSRSLDRARVAAVIRSLAALRVESKQRGPSSPSGAISPVAAGVGPRGNEVEERGERGEH